MSDTMRTIQSYSTYDEARHALERLLETGLPTDSVTISARGIRIVETVQRKGWLYAAGDGAVNGAMIGLLVGFFLGLMNLAAPGLAALVLGFWGALIGAVAGLATSLVVHAFRKDAERHTTQRSMSADHFDLRVGPEHADRARRALEETAPESAEAAAA